MLPGAATIFADGRPCPAALRRRLSRDRFNIALDGAAERARKERWQPHLITGDLDSVSKATLSYFRRKGVGVLPMPDQDHTDLEKAIAWCVLRDFESIWITQALGNRIDHSFSALSFLRKFHSPDRELLLFGEEERVRFARDEKLVLHGRTGRAFAVLPFPACTVSSRGLAFEMKGLDLALGEKESVSNKAKGKRVTLEIEGEALVVEGL
jgi:thiamine pyrophosphokinase